MVPPPPTMRILEDLVRGISIGGLRSGGKVEKVRGIWTGGLRSGGKAEEGGGEKRGGLVVVVKVEGS